MTKLPHDSELLLNSAAEGICGLDLEGRITFVNPAASKILGCEVEELIGRSVHSVLCCSHTPEMLFSTEECSICMTMREGIVHREDDQKISRKDGSTLSVEYRAAPVIEGDRIVGAVVTFQDITERKQIEERLRFLSTFVAQASEGMVVTDLDERILVANEAWTTMHGYSSPSELLGRPLHICHNQDQLENEIPHFIEEVMEEGCCRAEVGHKRRDGTVFATQMSTTLLKNQDGKPVAMLSIAVDITERKRMERELLQAQKLESVGQLAAGIAHEINTPIQFIGDNIRFLSDSIGDLLKLVEGYREILSGGKGDGHANAAEKIQNIEQQTDLPFLEEEMPRAMEQSLDGVQRVSKIVRAMKEFSHPDVTEKTPTDINKAIETTITVAQSEWRYVAEMVTNFDSSLPQVLCFPGEFNQVVLNMIINAAHAISEAGGGESDTKGTITVATCRIDDSVEIRISDTGAGIPEKARSKIFDPLFTTKEVGKGTGHGLAIAHSVVVDKHGGTLNFESEVGQGTTFIIRLPISHEQALAGETAS